MPILLPCEVEEEIQNYLVDLSSLNQSLARGHRASDKRLIEVVEDN